MSEPADNINREAMKRVDEPYRQPAPAVDHHSVLRQELSQKRAQLRDVLAHEETQAEAVRARLAGIEQMRLEAEDKLRHRLKSAEDVRTSLSMIQAALDAES